MQAQELRIGNYLEDNLFGVVKVYGINKDCVQIEDSKGDVYLLEIKDFSKPIPLTEEWLQKFGFDERMCFDEIGDRWFKGDFVLYRSDGRGFIHQATGKKLIYVHKLQNLYFELKDEELTIKND